MKDKQEVLAWEARWRTPVAVATIAGVLCLVASLMVVSGIGGGGGADFLREAEEQGSSIVLSGVLQALGFLLLGAALIYLFRAAQGRSERVRSQLIGLFVAAPIFLALGSGLNAVATGEAADKFTSGAAVADLSPSEAAKECREERDDSDGQEFAEKYDAGKDPLSDCTTTKLEDDEAKGAIADASAKGISQGLQLAGILGLAFSLLYGCLNAMRVGLLTRFWGSLGMALGVAAILSLVPFTWLWFLYFGFLLLGWVPNGRPPAWDAGEAIPWPTPGEKVATGMAPPANPDDPADPTLPAADPSKGGERRKRKQRD